MSFLTRRRMRREALAMIENAADGISANALHARLKELYPRAARQDLTRIIAQLDGPRIARRGSWLALRQAPSIQPAFLFSDPAPRGQSVIPAGAKESDYYGPLTAFIRATINTNYRFVEVGDETIGKPHWTFYNPDLIALSAHAAELGAVVPPELLAVEVKVNDKNPLEYLIQPLSYRLFAHRVILACRAPDQPNRKELLEARCDFFGIGLIYIEGKPAPQSFRVRLQAAFHPPSIPALGEFLQRLKDKPELYAALTDLK